MVCTGNTSRTCTGVVTGEICTYPKAVTNNLPPLEDITIVGDGDAIALMWNAQPQYADHIVRGHIRPSHVVGYNAEQIQVTARDEGALFFWNLDPAVRYSIWLRVEDADEANDWHYGSAYPTIPDPIPIYGVTYNGDLLVHEGDSIQHTQ